MRKKVSLISIFLVFSLMFTSNFSALALSKNDRIEISELTITGDEEFPIAVEQVLMDRALITAAETLTTSQINSIINESNVSKMNVNTEATGSFVKIDSVNIEYNALKICDEIYCAQNYIYSSVYNEGILTQLMYFTDGTIRKNVSYDYGGVIYSVSNSNNNSIVKDNAGNHIVEENLSATELSQFIELMNSGNIESKDYYSIEDVKFALIENDVSTVNDISVATNEEVAMYANTRCVTAKTAYAPGGNYTSSNATRPISAYYIGTYCTTISGLSTYNNGSNVAQILEYDTRKSYVELSNKKSIFDMGDDIMSIAAFAKLIFAKTVSALEIAGVLIDVYSRLSEPVEFYAEQDYLVAAYRESRIYDHTVENAYVELPQLYSQMVIGITYDEYIDGEYCNAQWKVKTRPEFKIPSEGIVDATKQQYANYVADIYYRNCIINGRWVHGRTAYGGLGG